ncbi:unnamed protein product, partial [Rotaria magnacalcarata]
FASSPSYSAASSIYTTGSVASDALGSSSTNLLSPTNGTMVNGQVVEPVDLQAFESHYHGRSLNDEQIFIVIYIIDTFRYELMGSSSNGENEDVQIDEAIDIYVKKAIFRAYIDLIKDLPEKISNRVNLQIIPFESIINQQIESDAELRLTRLKRLSFHVYDQLRQTVSQTIRGKSLTGFGPAIADEKMPAKIVMQLYTPAYILSPKSDFRFKSLIDITEQTNNNGSILFCSYCLSDDQRYLLTSCTDDRGELLETCSINIEVPDRHKRKVQYARRVALLKLWDFIMRIITNTTMPWRIVIGRLGRLGHGELKSWGIILSKKNLVRWATLIRESCSMCHILRSHDHPVILSACLVSLETHPLLAILPESLELGEMRGTQPSNNNSSMMQNGGQVLSDVSVTHILTLPTSASVQHVQAIPRLSDPRQISMDNDDDLFSSLFGTLDGDDFGNIQSPPPDLEFPPTGVFDVNHNGNPNGPMSRLNSLSISQHNYNGNDQYGNSLNSSNMKSNSLLHLDSEVDMNDIPTLHQQPLALGFYVSTISTLNPLPIWMLQGRCNQRLNNTSSVFKATLHVSVPNAQHSDDMLFAQSHDQKSIHPLDSNYTYVVLRHVLESYNRLSWLLIDAKTNERARRSLSSNETITPAWLLFKECEFPDNPYYILFISIVSCYLPLIIMIYVYIQLYLAAKKQVQALRSGYKHHYLRKSAKSFIPVFRLREPPTRRGASIQRTARIPESSARKLSFTLLPNRRPSFELITLRIHHGKYRNPTADHCRRSSRIENRSIQKATKKSERTNSLWRKISKNQKAAKFIGIIMGVFVVCWLPYFVYLIFSGVFGIRLKDDLNHELLFKIFSWLGYTNSLLDVLVYVSTSKELRVTLCKLVLGHRYRSKYNYP